MLALRHSLDRLDRMALGLAGEHQAGTDQPVVDGDAARAAVARTAAFLAAGEPEFVTQHVEERLVSLAQELGRLAVDRRRDVRLRHLALSRTFERDRGRAPCEHAGDLRARSEEHTSELQSLMRISYAVFCLKKKNT